MAGERGERMGKAVNRQRLFVYAMCLVGAYLGTTMFLLGLAALVYALRLSEQVVSIAIIICYILVTFVAGRVIGHKMGERRFLWGLLLGLGYFLILCILSVIISGNLQMGLRSFLTTLLLCAGSGMLGGMLS